MSRAPNIVFILPDQLRQDFLGCYRDWPSDSSLTPHMDRIALQGVRYLNAISAAPLCVPARTSLMTGMSSLRNGVLNNLQGLRPDYQQLGIQTWPQLLGAAGYTTAAMGKMHFYPWDERLGFQRRVVAEDKRWLHVRDDYYHFLRSHGLRRLHGAKEDGYHEHKGAVVSSVPWELSVDHFVGNAACDYLDSYDHDRPFALMIGFPGPHCPYDPSPDFLAAVDDTLYPPATPDERDVAPLEHARNVAANAQPWNGVDYSEFTVQQQQKLRRHYAALVSQVDHEVGRVMRTLERRGLLENTIVVLSSDHGDYLGEHGMVGKGSFFEAAVRVPLLIRPPGGSTAESRSELVELHDITATLLSVAGITAPAWMDSAPLPADCLPGESAGRDSVTGVLAEGWMQHDGRFKLHVYRTGELLLFDLDADPREQQNLAADPNHADTFRRLISDLAISIMESTNTLTHDRLADATGLTLEPFFGVEGWQRPWPFPVPT